MRKKSDMKNNKKNILKKHGLRYKAAVSLFSLFGIAALALTSCTEEEPIKYFTPYKLSIDNIPSEYDAKRTALVLVMFCTEQRDVRINTYVDSEQKTKWSITDDDFDLDNVDCLRKSYVRYDNHIEIDGPTPKVTISGLTEEELITIYNNLSLSYGNLSISQENSIAEQNNECYNLTIDRYKSKNLNTLLNSIDSEKISIEDDGPVYFCGTRDDLVFAFNLKGEAISVKYIDNAEPIQSCSEALGDKLQNPTLTIEQDDIPAIEQNNITI